MNNAIYSYQKIFKIKEKISFMANFLCGLLKVMEGSCRAERDMETEF